MVIHVFACAWYVLACPMNECSEEHNWVEHQGNLYRKLDISISRVTIFLLMCSLLGEGGGN